MLNVKRHWAIWCNLCGELAGMIRYPHRIRNARDRFYLRAEAYRLYCSLTGRWHPFL